MDSSVVVHIFSLNGEILLNEARRKSAKRGICSRNSEIIIDGNI